MNITCFLCGCFENKRRTLKDNILAKVGIIMDSMDTPTQNIKFLMENKETLLFFSKFLCDISKFILNFTTDESYVRISH